MCGGVLVRESLQIANWQAAQARVSAAEAFGNWKLPKGQEATVEPISIAEAIRKFMNEIEHGRRLSDVTLGKYRLLFRDLTSFSGRKGFRYVKELGLDQLREFRDSWSYEIPEQINVDGKTVLRRAPLSPRTALKKLERVRSFGGFCHESGWIEKNWAKMIHGPRKIKELQKLPFEPDELERILEAVPKIDLRVRTAFELETFILVMRYTGLRIGDTALLTNDRIKGDELYLYTQKSGTHVYVPLPPFLVQRLSQITLKQGKYFFVIESLNVEPLADCWRRKIKRVFDLAGIPSGTQHPHRFRHTFAVELLKEGVPLEDVSVLLGHGSVRITERHYAAWVKARQQRLRANVTRTWRFETAQRSEFTQPLV